MPEIRSTDQPDEFETDRDNFAPRPRELNRSDCRPEFDEEVSLRQSPPPRAIRPINCDCNKRCRPARPRPLPGRPSRGSNLFSSSAIHEDMRRPGKRLKCLSNERWQSAVCCAGRAAQSLSGASTETDSLPKKRCADKDIARIRRRADFRFILPSRPASPVLIRRPHSLALPSLPSTPTERRIAFLAALAFCQRA